MSFTFPSLFFLWIAPLVALPVLIHLINLLRHRRVQWAAMEFLLESKKKHQNWVRLKQLLLLLMRMAAVAAIVFMMARPMLEDEWSRLFGGGDTHHVILLDDSGSMTDQGPDGSAFDQARKIVANVVARAAQQTTQHSLTFVRFSRAASEERPEILHEPIDREFLADFEQLKSKLKSTQLALDPLKAIDVMERAVEPDKDENLVVYVVSDLRSEQWQDATAVRQALRRLTDMDAQLQLVHCVKETRPNLALTHLAPIPGQQAAGVMLKMDVEVTNFGTQTSTPTSVQLRQRVHTGDPGDKGEIVTLGAVKFDGIAPGDHERKQFEVTFNSAGYHEVLASLPADALAADNERFCVLNVPPAVPVLILDGLAGKGAENPVFLKIVLSSNPKVRTGIKSQIESPYYLREQPIDHFHTIFGINFGQLDSEEIETLENYLRGGGGLVVFCSDVMHRNFVNDRLYRGGEGFFPVPLSTPANLLVEQFEKTPDISVDHEHLIFRAFANKFNTFVQRMRVERYFVVAKGWRPEDDANVTILARLRNGAPLIVEKRFGNGRVLAVLTTATPIWNNFALEFPFPPTLLDMQVHLGANKVFNPIFEIGTPYQSSLPEGDYQAEVEFVVPTGGDPLTITNPARIDPDDQTQRIVRLDDANHHGIYEVRLQRLDGSPEVRRLAYNFVESESDLKTMDEGELRAALDGVEFQYRELDEFLAPVEDENDFALAEQWWFFLALVVLLILEQLLAYSASYHPSLAGGLSR